jgi:hypothetical protein
MLQNPYYPLTPREQAVYAVKDAGIEWNCGENGILAIWPKRGHRAGPVPVLSPQNDLLNGYPSYTQTGIKLNTIQ